MSNQRYTPEFKDEAIRQVIDRGHSVAEAELSMIQTECISINDEIRWLIALVSDTGMRLSEAAGLYWTDVQLDGEIKAL